MKCVLCKICQASRIILDKKLAAWLDTQTNSVDIMQREADPEAVYQAYDLVHTDPAESFRQNLALAERGSIWSMASVGQMFEAGIGTAPDLAQAEQWYLRAYQAGSDYALIWLGTLYDQSGQYEKAQEVFRAGVARGFVPAMVRLASSYRDSPNWPRKRGEALALLEHGSAAGDVSARRVLASAMARGRFGWRYIPDGIRRLYGVAGEMADLVKDEVASAHSDSRTQPGFFSRLATQLWLLGATRHPAS